MDWRCKMCNITLDQAVEKQFSFLKLTADEIVDENLDQRKRQYRWERTQKKPKATCSWECGMNYKAWNINQDPKGSYYQTPARCDCCRKQSTRGRILKKQQGEIKICFICWRKKIINDARLLWEIFNHDHRLAYKKAWDKANRKKINRYRRKYYHRIKTGKVISREKRRVSGYKCPAVALII